MVSKMNDLLETKTTVIENWIHEAGTTPHLQIRETQSCTDHQDNVKDNICLTWSICKVT